VPDYKKSLAQLRTEWQDCTKCDLGTRRVEEEGVFVFGEGMPRGIMFIGEGPGVEEESSGRPFVGRSGALLRGVIEQLHIVNYYITNIVCCRSCKQAVTAEGEPIFRYNKVFGDNRPLFRDTIPSPLQIAACLPRLYEEIYLVDPIYIVALGGEALKTLTIGRPPKGITDERGKPREVEIPGAGFVPILTSKKQQWQHKVKGELVQKMQQGVTKYTVTPTYHPAYALRNEKDRRVGNPTDCFLQDISLVAKAYNKYMKENFGIIYEDHDVYLEDALDAIED